MKNSTKLFLITVVVYIVVLAGLLLVVALTFAETPAELLVKRTQYQKAITEIEELVNKEQKAWMEGQPYKNYEAQARALAAEFEKTKPALAYTERMKVLLGKRREAQLNLEKVKKDYSEALK